jgi:photosystem II stability/assembly factor-like uncharacterized protein
VRILAVVPVLSLSVSAQWSTASAGVGVDANLRGVSISHSAFGKYTVWVSGTKGTVLRSSDEGKSWEQRKIDGADDLDFRDIEGFGAHSAYAMSSGDGEKSRIYKTANDGKSWTLQYTDKRTGFFLDSLACDSTTHCFALSDPVEGKFLILTTSDGEHWRELPRDKMPAALPAEGAFAASGTSIALCGKSIYFGTGGPAARVFHSADRGRSWTAVTTPMASGNASSGIFSIACRGSHLVAVGGDYREPGAASKVAVYSTDSGTTWHLADQQPGGYRSGVVFLSGKDFAAVGPNGTDVSRDAGAHWSHAEALNLNAAAFAAGHGWAVGPKGVVAHFSKSSP